MIERINSRLETKRKEAVILTRSAVHLNHLIQQSAEHKTPRISPTRVEINYSHSLAHPHAFYPLICNPLFAFVDGLGMNYILKGSLVRQAADNILFGQTTKNLVSYILRTFDFPFDDSNLSNEAQKMYRELLLESDIDIKFSGDMSRNEEILTRSLPIFVKRLSNLLVDNYSLWKRPREEAKNFKKIGKQLKQGKKVEEEDFDHLKDKVQRIEGPDNVIAAYRVIHPNLQVADIFRLFSKTLNVEQIIDNQTGALVVYVKKITIRGKMPVYKLFFAVDRKNDRPNLMSEPIKEDELQTFFSIDFSQTFSKKEASKYDNRVGKGCNSHEITGKSIKTPLPLLGKIDDESSNVQFLAEYENFPPSIYVYVPRKQLENYRKPVILGTEWGNKEDLDALETFSRGMIQAVEFGVNNGSKIDLFDKESLVRASLRFTQLGKVDRSSFQFESFRYNTIKSFLVSPHKTVEYLGKSGLWKIIFGDKLGVDLSEVLEKLNSLENNEIYQQKINQILKNLNEWGRYDGEDFQSGLFLIDKVLGLEILFPQYKSYYERLYRLLTD